MRITSKAMLAISASFLMFACQKDETLSGAEEQISDVTLAQIKALGFGTSNVQKHEDGYLVEGDIVLTPEMLKQTPDQKLLRVAGEEQYHTTNVVTGTPRTITVSLSGRNITQRMIDGVNGAISRYNAENLALTFAYGGTSGGGTINISVVNTGQYIASAGFPSGGNPYGTIKYAKTYTNYSLGFVTTVIAHEIGHCIGFRHTDYMSRQYSCGGSAVNEGASSVGAIHIPGTPTGPDPNSWMLACLSSTTNRPFNANDKVDPNYLY